MIKRKLITVLMAAVVISFLSVSIYGCSPAMRKKFIREKKKTDIADTLIPILEPEDYVNQLDSARTRYDYFYALLKVWHKDALMLIDNDHSTKQMVYTIHQMRVQLEELDKIISGESEQTIGEGIQRVNEILAYYDKPEAFRNRDIIRRDIQHLTDDVIRPLSFESVKNNLRME